MTSSSSGSFQRVLYLRQEQFPDNYVNEDFLQGLMRNQNVQPYDYWICVQECSIIVQQLSLVILFLSTFQNLSNSSMSASLLISINTILLLGFVRVLWKHLFSICIFVFLLLGLSPVLQTLTQAYSSDTIWALIVFLLLLHLFTQDYSFMNGYSTKMQAAISLNSILFVSVLFASQLPSYLHSFSIITFCIELFALFPIAKQQFSTSQTTITWILFFGSAIYSWMSTFYLLSLLYVTTSLMIAFIVPSWLIQVQRQYKNVMKGPWTEFELSL